jgi:hypothetical protein
VSAASKASIELEASLHAFKLTVLRHSTPPASSSDSTLADESQPSKLTGRSQPSAAAVSLSEKLEQFKSSIKSIEAQLHINPLSPSKSCTV